jgi:hypothetical protein
MATENEGPGSWDQVSITLYEGGWVSVDVYPLTFHAEGETFDALWTLCEQMTES